MDKNVKSKAQGLTPLTRSHSGETFHKGYFKAVLKPYHET